MQLGVMNIVKKVVTLVAQNRFIAIKIYYKSFKPSPWDYSLSFR